jgi:hypothetical protein
MYWDCLMSEPRITYTPRPNASPEAEISALAAIYRFLVLEKGERNDLTGTSTKECATSQDKKGNENADLHGN